MQTIWLWPNVDAGSDHIAKGLRLFNDENESNKVQFEEVFQLVLSNTKFVWAGFFGLFCMVLLRWKDFLPLVPLLGLAMLSFFSWNRFFYINWIYIITIYVKKLIIFFVKKMVVVGACLLCASPGGGNKSRHFLKITQGCLQGGQK